MSSRRPRHRTAPNLDPAAPRVEGRPGASGNRSPHGWNCSRPGPLPVAGRRARRSANRVGATTSCHPERWARFPRTPRRPPPGLDGQDRAPALATARRIPRSRCGPGPANRPECSERGRPSPAPRFPNPKRPASLAPRRPRTRSVRGRGRPAAPEDRPPPVASARFPPPSGVAASAAMPGQPPHPLPVPWRCDRRSPAPEGRRGAPRPVRGPRRAATARPARHLHVPPRKLGWRSRLGRTAVPARP